MSDCSSKLAAYLAIGHFGETDPPAPMNVLIREFNYASRRLRASPAFTITSTLTLAIAIGATASVFGLVDGVLFKAATSIRDPERLLMLWESSPVRRMPQFAVAPAN